MPDPDGCENPMCDIHDNEPDEPTEEERRSVEPRHDDHICGDECPPDERNARRFAPDEGDVNLLVVAIDQHYDVRDLEYAGDSRTMNIHDRLTGAYIMTATLTKSL